MKECIFTPIVQGDCRDRMYDTRSSDALTRQLIFPCSTKNTKILKQEFTDC